MDFALAATDSGLLYTSVFYCGGKPVGSWRIYIIMVIGAHDSMIIIKNGGNAIYGATLVTLTLVPRPHLEKLISITLTLIISRNDRSKARFANHRIFPYIFP